MTGETETVCCDSTVRLLCYLAGCGFKVSRKKLQFCLPQVSYLGFILSKGKRELSQDIVQIVAESRVPATKQALLAFLGLINYCRQWIPDCSYYDKVLRERLVHTDPLTSPIQWSPEKQAAFTSLKSALQQAPALGVPNYSLPFLLYTTEQAAWDKLPSCGLSI